MSALNRVQRIAQQIDKKSTPLPLKIVLVGPPGSGKGTYASIISKEYNIPAISTGDLVRAEIASGSELGQSIKAKSSAGELLSDDVIIKLLEQRLTKPDVQNGYILDGFPRTVHQAEQLEKITSISIVLALEMSYAAITTMVVGRRSCKNCNRTYNIGHVDFDGVVMNPLLPKKEGVCDECGANPLVYVQRSDDTEAVVQNRLNQYDKFTKPVIQFYKELPTNNLLKSKTIVMTHNVKRGKFDWPEMKPKFDKLVKTSVSH